MYTKSCHIFQLLSQKIKVQHFFFFFFVAAAAAVLQRRKDGSPGHAISVHGTSVFSSLGAPLRIGVFVVGLPNWCFCGWWLRRPHTHRKSMVYIVEIVNGPTNEIVSLFETAP